MLKSPLQSNITIYTLEFPKTHTFMHQITQSPVLYGLQDPGIEL